MFKKVNPCIYFSLLGVDKLFSYAISEWLNDIKKNQLPGILGGVGPMHSLVQLGKLILAFVHLHMNVFVSLKTRQRLSPLQKPTQTMLTLCFHFLSRHSAYVRELSDLGVVSSFSVQGLKDLVWLPIEQYRKDGRIVRGFQRGAASFGTSTAMAALELTNRMVQTIQVECITPQVVK